MAHTFFPESRRNGMRLKALFEKLKTISAAGLLTASFVVTPSVQAANWAGTPGNWSSNGNPGWNGTGVPDAVGAVANKSTSPSSVTTQDVVAGVTVGTIQFTTVGSAIKWELTLTNGITLNQDGAGSGTATISNANTGGGGNFIRFQSGTLTLADNLLITNTGNSNQSASNGGSINFASTSVIAGTGNITIDNVLNGATGAIVMAGANTFTGSVNLRSGRTFASGNSFFGDNANQITLGAEGAGNASLFFSGGVNNQNYTWVVAAGSGGTLTMGSESTM
jgi:fibronectin-binding autotransporter adhesin